MRRQTRPEPRRQPRRPGAGRPRASRRGVRAAVRQSRRTPVLPPPGSGLTTRAAVLGLVLCALVVSAALPLRELLDQRGEIAELRQAQAARQERVAALEQQRRLLDDPGYVAGLARDRLQFVKPGERVYVVLAPEQEPVPVAEGSPVAPVGAGSPWYSQLWGSVQGADRPGSVPPP